MQKNLKNDLPPLLRRAKLILFSRKNGTFDSVQGFWCRPMTTHGSFLHNSNKCWNVKRIHFKVQINVSQFKKLVLATQKKVRESADLTSIWRFFWGFLTLWAKSWCRYNQSSKAKLVNTSLDWLIKTCLTGSLRTVDSGLPVFWRVAKRLTNCLNILKKMLLEQSNYKKAAWQSDDPEAEERIK